jgi:hypothetical protein
MNETAVFCFVKANPPTKAHYQLFRKVIATAHAKEGDPLIFLSQAYDAQKNPIPWKLKTKYIFDFLKEYTKKTTYVCFQESVKTVLDAMQFIYQRNYKKVIFIVGNELLKDMEALLETNNDKDGETTTYYKFDSINVVSSGGTDPDIDIKNSVYSGSQARNAVLDNDFEKFYSIVMASNETQGRQLFSMVKAGLGITEKIRLPWTRRI